ncbi:MAG: TorF family putative porin, partial [Shewanella sp.]
GEGFDSYSDYSVGVSTELMGFGLSLAWLSSDLSGEQKVSDGVFQNDDTALARVSYAF